MVVGLLGNESSDSNRLTLVTPKSENDVRLQATLDNQNPTGLPVGYKDSLCQGNRDIQRNISIFFIIFCFSGERRRANETVYRNKGCCCETNDKR